MKKQTVSLAVFGLLLVCLAFVLGYLLGSGGGETEVVVTALPPEPVVSAPEIPAAEVSAVSAEGETPIPTEQSPLNLNTATQAELEQLPGVGPELAARILAYRRDNGKFVTTEQIMDVEGIGEKRYENMKHLITVGGTP